jgi:hypothetical protein
MISETEYSSLKSLERIMHLVDGGTFAASAHACGLTKVNESEINLKLGKKFLISSFKRMKPA